MTSSVERLARERRRPMRVALAVEQFDRVTSGPGTFVQYLRSATDPDDMEIVFFSEDIRDPRGETEQRVELSSWERNTSGQLSRFYSYHRAVKEHHSSAPFDAIWFSTPSLGVFSSAMIRDVPIIVMINDYNNIVSRVPFSTRSQFGLRTSFIRSVLYWIERRAVRSATSVVVNSKFLKDLVVSAYQAHDSDVHIMYKAVDCSRFSPRVTGIEEPVRILFLKSDFMRGGLPDVFAALANAPFRHRLTIAGPGEEQEPKLHELAAAAMYAGGFDYIGRVAHEAIPDLFARHDFLVVPTRSEALGVAFLEGLASGTTVIAGDVGGVPEVLDHGRAGYLVEPNNPARLHEVMVDALSKADERMRRQRHGVVHAKRYSVGAMVSRFQEITANAMLTHTSRTGS